MTPHFTYAEAIRTRTGLGNTPSPEVAANIGVTAIHMEAVRALFDKPIKVTSWYRSPAVNVAVGGSISSDHMKGYAVDFVCDAADNYTIACIIEKSGLRYDQLILEYGWIHISFAPAMRQQSLTKKSASSPYLQGLYK